MRVRYPMPASQARERRWDLEREMRQVDAVLRVNPTAELDRHRELLQREFDRLFEALETMEANRERPLCVTGKITHGDREEARAHLRCLRLVVERPDPKAHLLNTYRCRTCWCWHVGHRREDR